MLPEQHELNLPHSWLTGIFWFITSTEKDGKFEMSDGEWFFWVHLLWSKWLNANWWWIHAGNVITLWHCEMKIKTFKSKHGSSTVAPMRHHKWNGVPGKHLLLLLFAGCTTHCHPGTGMFSMCCNMLSPPISATFWGKRRDNCFLATYIIV